ncbi:hypothetical protein FRB97_005544 [Tulasnella sp. 331]|nr:hypothetical protein FRB97_005544 [Tulasnella sp. 331]
MAFILNQPRDFPKQRIMMNVLRNLTGEGLVVAEGPEHKRQRKIINPAFGVTAMRGVTPMIIEVAHEPRDAWKKKLFEPVSDSGWQDIDVLPWLSNTALDMVGVAGSNVANNRSRAVMERIGSQMVMEKKSEAGQLGESSPVRGKDLLGILVRANLQEKAAERLDDKTLLAAGHETTAVVMAWALEAIAKTPSVQSKLRDEALTYANDSPSMEGLNSLPYLNNVVKEILRLKPPFTGLRRTAQSDMIVPLAQPIIDKNEKEVQEIFLRSGDSILMHLYAINTRFDLWGSDALLFRPERFDKIPDAVSEIPSMFGNVTSFGVGPKACVGWRMAVLEIKALLFTLIREFQLDVDPRMTITSSVVPRPQVQGQEDKGPQLPLRVARFHHNREEGTAQLGTTSTAGAQSN